jgi:hypothetical protein
MDLHIFSILENEEVVSVMQSVYMYVSVPITWTATQILFIFGIQKFISHKLVPRECEHSSSKNRGPS